MLHRIAYNLMLADWRYRRALVPLDRLRALLRPAPVLPALTRLAVREAAGDLSPALYPGLVLHDEVGYTAIFAQRSEKVKVGLRSSVGLSRPPQRGPRHDGSSVRKVYFLHTAALQSQAGLVFSPSSCTYRCQNHRADSVQRRWLLARLRSCGMRAEMYIR